MREPGCYRFCSFAYSLSCFATTYLRSLNLSGSLKVSWSLAFHTSFAFPMFPYFSKLFYPVLLRADWSKSFRRWMDWLEAPVGLTPNRRGIQSSCISFWGQDWVLLHSISSTCVAVSWAEVGMALTMTFCSQILGLSALPLRRTWLVPRTSLDYPFALPKHVFRAFNKCCPWSRTSRFCSVLWPSSKNRSTRIVRRTRG